MAVQLSDFVLTCNIVGNDSYDMLESIGNSIHQLSRQRQGASTSPLLCIGDYSPTEQLEIEITSIHKP
jgi:hypothetical protein